MQIIVFVDLPRGCDCLLGKNNNDLSTIQAICVNIPSIVKVSLFSILAMSVIKTKNSEKYGFRGKSYF